MKEVNPQLAKRRINEMYFAGLIVSAILGLNTYYFGDIFLLANFQSPYVGIIIPYEYFLIDPVLIFAILYFWGSKRILPYFREKYWRVTILLFLGSLVGNGASYFASTFATGGSFSSVPSFYLVMFSLGFTLAVVESSLTVIFIGFTAIGLAYFRFTRSKGKQETGLESYL